MLYSATLEEGFFSSLLRALQANSGTVFRDRDLLGVEIEDKGCGLSPQELSNIFRLHH
jgi:hypothetical protein